MGSGAEATKPKPRSIQVRKSIQPLVWKFLQLYIMTEQTKANLFWREWTFCSLNFNSSDILSFWTVTFSRLFTTRWTQCEKYNRPFTNTNKETNKQKNSETGGKLSSKGRKEGSYQNDSIDIEKYLKSIKHNNSKNTRNSKSSITDLLSAADEYCRSELLAHKKLGYSKRPFMLI